MSEKYKCNKCNELAVWLYLPSDGDGQYCDNCVKRGCSCNMIYEEDADGNEVQTSEQYKDEMNRLLPCCEYIYDASGFEIID